MTAMLNRRSSQVVPKEIQTKLDLFFGDLKTAGVSYIGHGVVSEQGDHTGYFSNKTWGQFYVQNRYFFVEPILENYKEEKFDLISWRTLEDAHAIALTRNEYTKITSGMTICKKEDAFNTFFNIGFDKDIDIIEFSFFKRDLLLSYFSIFNNYHVLWRKGKGE